MFRTMKRMVGVAVLLTLVCAIALSRAHAGPAATPAGGPNFQDRVRAQEAIDRVYYAHRTWPKENPGPKPLFDEVMSRADLEAKVNDALLKSAALEKVWQVPVTAEQLQAEMDRMARETKAPETLRELFAALGNDPALTAECLARPALVDRLIHEKYASDERFHTEIRSEAEALRGELTPGNFQSLGGSRYHAVQIERVDGQKADILPGGDSGSMRLSTEAFSRTAADFPEEGKISDVVELPDAFVITLTGYRDDNLLTGGVIVFPKKSFDSWWEDVSATLAPTPTLPAAPAYTLPSLKPRRAEVAGSPSPAPNLPGRIGSTGLSTGAETLAWGGGTGVSYTLNTGLRYDPATDTRTALPAGFPCPSARWGHTAVWTGTEMIVWGGTATTPPHTPTNTGGRYNPLIRTWAATSTKAPCPTPSVSHAVMWTGKVMAVQGGTAPGVSSSRTGGRYNPATDTWAAGTTESGGPTPTVTATVGATGATYTTLQAALADINDGALTGAIILDVVDSTTETTTAALFASGGAASYTSVLIRPSGGAPRTISGAIPAGNPLIDLNGADNVTFDGLNTGGNSLTISNTTASATSGTSTIRFVGGAMGNTVTNATVLGSFSATVATNGGNIYFATDALTANGNDNNTISFCSIGPAGANLPTKGIYGNGTATNATIGNNGIIIDSNNIYDTFGAAVTSAGVYIAGGCSGWTITNNKFYQTAPRTWTTGANNYAIFISNTAATTGAQNFTITGNTIGYASSSGTGTYTLTGSTGKFTGILFAGLSAGTASSISNNTITAVSLTGVTSSGTNTGSPFMGILVNYGVANTNGNTIGSQAATGSLTFSTNTTTATDVYGIYNFGFDNWTANSNAIGGISVTNAAASGTFIIYGMRANTGTSVAFSASSNFVGGTVANSIQLSATGTASQVIGMHSNTAACNFSLNTIRNLATNIGTGTTTGASVIGIDITTATPNHTVSQNTITGLTNSNATAASVVTGIQFTGGTANVVQRNLIYGLTAATNSATAEVNGIRVGGGTTVYRNNMIALGAGIANAIGSAATNSGTSGINGINEFLGTDSFFHNSVYIGGSPTIGTGASYAFNGTQTVNTRSFRDNIFVNARNNAGATGKNYSVKINGTAANPTGLTINNNVYLASGAGGVFGFFNSLDVANLAAWKTAVGQDAASFESNPQYLDPGNPVPDLHINPLVSTVIEGNGADVLVTDDYDGQTRAGLTPVDIGADAGNFIGIDLIAPAISYTALGNTSSTGDRTLTAAITDVTGVSTSGALRPRVYYKKSAGGTWFSSQGSLASGSGTSGTWNFTIVAADMGGVATADVIYYYVIAQDIVVPTPNIGSNPAGAVASDVNTVTTPPALPNTYTIVAAFNGSHNVGTTELYTSLTNAGGIFEAINAGTLTGNITINITSDLAGELGTNALNQWAEDGVGGYTMLIRPSGAARTVTGSNAGALIRFYGADRVTMDGSTTGATATGVGGNAAIRELTIQNTNTGTLAAVMAVMMGINGAVGNTLRNINFLGQDPTTTLVGLALGGNTPGTAGTDNDGNRVENCSIKRAIYGLYDAGQSAANPNTGTVLTMNDLSATGGDRIRRIGIVVFNESGISITENAIGGIDTNESADAVGIGVGAQLVDNVTTTSGGVTNASVSRNKITGVNSQSAVGFSAAGIAVAGGAGGANTIADNMIAGVTSPATSPDITAGIFVAGVSGSSTRLYHNSVAMTGDRGAVASQTPSFGLAVTGTDPVVELKNNIFYTTQTSSGGGANATSYAIGLVTTTFANLDSNYNVFWSTGANDGGFRTGSLAGGVGMSYATLALWQTAVSDDANSLEGDPLFVSPTTDLHLQPCPAASPAVGAGTPIPSVTVDIDGQTRSATAPDIGADEVAKIAVTNPAVTSGTVGVAFSQVFTQSGGIAPVTFTTGSALPAGLALAADGTLSGMPTSSGTFPITVTVTDTNGCIGTGPVYNLTVDAQADLAITKTDGVITATPGGSVTYTITASNAGPASATATVADTFPAVFTGTWTCVGAGGGTCTAAGSGNINDSVNLPTGGSVTYTVTASISPSATGTLSNTATVTGIAPDPNPADNSATDSDTLVPPPDLSITKSDGGTSVAPGGTVAYTLTYANTGTTSATGVVLTETVPANTTFNPGASTAGWICVPNNNAGSTGTLAIGGLAGGGGPQSATFAVTVVNPVAAGVAQISNTAHIADDGAHGADPNPGNNSASDATPVNATPDLSISKSDGGASVAPGGTVAYTLMYTNTGNQGATGVVLTETVPANTTFNPGASTAGWVCVPNNNAGSTCTLAVGGLAAGGGPQSATFAVTVVNPVTAGVAQISNTASIADDGANGSDPTPGNNTGSDTTPVTGAPDFSITKSDGGASVIPGGTVAYTLTYANTGNRGAAGVVLAETVPANTMFNAGASTAGWVCVPNNNAGSMCTLAVGGLAAGGGPQSATFAITVDSPLPAGITQISNTASIADDGANGTDPTPGNNTGSDTTPVIPTSDLSITKTDSPDPVIAGQNITYTITMANNGPSNAQSVTVTDAVPANATFVSAAVTTGSGWTTSAPAVGGTGNVVFSKASVAAGETAVFTMVVNVNVSATDGSTVTNTATAASATTDPTPGNNAASTTTTVNAQADLAVVKTGPATVTPGGTITYAVTLTNNGPGAALSVTLGDLLPAPLTFVSQSQTSGPPFVVGNAGNQITDTLATLAAGASASFQMTAAVSTGAAVGSVISNTATASSAIPDPSPSNNSSTATATVVCPTVTLTPGTLPGGTAGTAYSQTISATPAGTSYAYAGTAGSLPPGLTLDTNSGALTGTPTTNGTYTFTITASGWGTCTGSQAYTVTIACPAITLAALPNGTANMAYSSSAAASPAGTYTYAVTLGSMPPGLTLNTSTGAVTGTPTTNGTYGFTITATGWGTCTGSQAYTVTIACPTITLSPASPLPGATVGTVPYSQTFAASPAGTTYTYTVTAGVLPPGLTLNPATGVLSGTVTAAGNTSFTVTATGWGTCTGSRTYSLTAACPAITVSPASLPGALAGTSYSQILTASGGSAPYTYAVTGGSLPGGLTLNPDGTLTGTPTANGTFTFTVTATDANGCTGSISYTIGISAFDLSLFDDAGQSQVCVNSATGAFNYTILRGVGIGSYAGAGSITRINGQLTLTTPPGLPYSLTLKYLERYHKATATFTNLPRRVRSSLTDSNTLNDPPVCH